MLIRRLVFLVIIQQVVVALQTEKPVVFTEAGKFEGTTVTDGNGKKVKAFLGVPYAKPPVGELRFRPPEKNPKFEGILQTASRSKACVQFTNLVDDLWIASKEDTSEDCLYLNIWVPYDLQDGAAVLFFLHGGGFEAGTANSNRYDGRYLASERNVIFVSTNYRLSALGFLLLDDIEAPGNVGLMDQALALQWVKEHIARFGGDPQKVTLVGSSAGARSAGYHLSIPSSDGLFRRAILLSGTSTTILPEFGKTQARSKALELSRLFGCDMDIPIDIVECLRAVSVQDLVKTVLQFNKKSFLPFAPVVDGEFLPLTPKISMKNGINSSLDIMLGTLSEDGALFLDSTKSGLFSEKDLTFLSQTAVGAGNTLAAKIAKYLYAVWDTPDNMEKRRRQILDFATDYYYVCPLSYTAAVAAENGNTVYRYQLNHRPSNSKYPTWMGMVHGDEVDYFFGWPLDKSKGFSTEDEKYTKRMMEYFTNFAKTGNPNSPSCKKIKWPKYSTESEEYLYIASELKVKHGLRKQQCEFWNNLLPDIIEEVSNNDSTCDIKEKN